MFKIKIAVTLLLASGVSMPAMAHVFYTGFGLGAFTGLQDASGTKNNANFNISSMSGWADAADADWGDSHKGRFLKFSLDNPANVDISVTSNNTNFLPGFSVYQGLSSTAGHDYSTGTIAWRALQATPSDPLAATEGAWNALGDFCLTNASGVEGCLKYVGYGVDGTATNFDSTNPNIPSKPGIFGDGLADGSVSKQFLHLAAGDYSIVVGGANYGGIEPSGFAPTFNTSIHVAPVPAPGALSLFLSGLGLLSSLRKRKSFALQQI